MAEGSSGHELLVNLTAALEKVAVACGLPKGWTAEPSFRLTPKGASLMVIWNQPSPAAENQRKGAGKKTKSKSTLERSAERGRRHKERQQRPNLGQQLGSTPLSKKAQPFVPDTRQHSAPIGSRESGGGTTGLATTGGAQGDELQSNALQTTPSPEPRWGDKEAEEEMSGVEREKRKREGGREQLAPQPWGLLAELSPQSQIDICRNWLREMVSRGEARGVEQASAALVGLEGKEEAMKFMGALLESRGVT